LGKADHHFFAKRAAKNHSNKTHIFFQSKKMSAKKHGHNTEPRPQSMEPLASQVLGVTGHFKDTAANENQCATMLKIGHEPKLFTFVFCMMYSNAN